MQVHECLNNSCRPGLLTHCPVKKMKVGQRERATNLSLSCVEIKLLNQLNFLRTYLLRGREGGISNVNKIKRNENQNQKTVKTSRIYMRTTELVIRFKKFSFVSQYDAIHLKHHCKKAEAEVLTNGKIKKDYYMSLKEGLGNNYIMSQAYRRSSIEP